MIPLLSAVLLVAVAAVLRRGAWTRLHAPGVRARLTGDARTTRNQAVAYHHPRPVPGWFLRRIEDLAVPADPVAVWRGAWLLSAVVGGGALLAGGPTFAGLVLVAGGGTVALGVEFHRGRADRLVDAGLPGLLDQVASGLRAGLGLSVALVESLPTTSGPLQRDLAGVAGALDAGVPLARVLERWQARRPTAGTRLVTAALALSLLTGGRSRPLDGVASTLRERLAVERELRAVSAQVRASAVVLVATPWAFVAFSAAQDAEVIGFFTGSLAGSACLAGGVLLDLAGAWLMSRVLKGVR